MNKKHLETQLHDLLNTSQNFLTTLQHFQCRGCEQLKKRLMEKDAIIAEKDRFIAELSPQSTFISIGQQERIDRTIMEAMEREQKLLQKYNEAKDTIELFKNQLEAYKNDFEEERRDRIKAHTELDNVKTQLTEQREQVRRLVSELTNARSIIEKQKSPNDEYMTSRMYHQGHFHTARPVPVGGAYDEPDLFVDVESTARHPLVGKTNSSPLLSRSFSPLRESFDEIDGELTQNSRLSYSNQRSSLPNVGDCSRNRCILTNNLTSSQRQSPNGQYRK